MLTYAIIIAATTIVLGYAPPPLVDMGSCIDFAVVAGATITNSGFSFIDGDLGLSPGSAVVGFPPGEISGTMHVTDSIAAACMSDLAIAIADANSRPADATMSGELGGMTLAPGVYKSDGGFAITNILYLDGQNDPEAAWIFIMATTLTVNTGASVVMLNYDYENTTGINVWWSCGERADIFANAAMQGTVMAYQSIAALEVASTGPLMANIGEVTLLSNLVRSYTVPVAIISSMPTPIPTAIANPCPFGWSFEPVRSLCVWLHVGYSWDECNEICAINNVSSICVYSDDFRSFLVTILDDYADSGVFNASLVVGCHNDNVSSSNSSWSWRSDCTADVSWNYSQIETNNEYSSLRRCGFLSQDSVLHSDSCDTRSDQYVCGCESPLGSAPALMATIPSVFQSPTYTVRNAFAFHALNTYTHNVITWGEAPYGGNSSSVSIDSNVKSVAQTRYSYAAVKHSGSVHAWGDKSAFARIDALSTASITRLVSTEVSLVGIMVAPHGLFACGSRNAGGSIPLDLGAYLSMQIKNVIATAAAFAALTIAGDVFTWGNVHCGAGPSSLNTPALTGIKFLASTREAFAAVTHTGRVYSWGGKMAGGNSSLVASALSSGVVHVVGGRTVFVAFKESGGIVVWGYKNHGGVIASSAVAASVSANVTYVAFTSLAVAALKRDGGLIAWGDVRSGGDCSAVTALAFESITSNMHAFAARSKAGSVVAWGRADYGGVIPLEKVPFLTGVVRIYSTLRAFAALKDDGSVVAWGAAGFGGNPSTEVMSLLTDVHTVCSNEVAFSAIKLNGSVVAWGHSVSVAMPGVILQDVALTKNVTCA